MATGYLLNAFLPVSLILVVIFPFLCLLLYHMYTVQDINKQLKSWKANKKKKKFKQVLVRFS